VKLTGRAKTCPRIEGRDLILSGYDRYLRDESSLRGGVPSRIYLPTTVGELSAAVREVGADGGSLTVSGARTGIVGGAVPEEGGNLLALDRMKGEPSLSYCEERGRWTVRVPASLTVEGLEAALTSEGSGGGHGSARGLFYPVDPTETGASLGGTVATNASGARTYRYGPTRRWVAGLTVVLADGSVARLRRTGGMATPPSAGGAGMRIAREMADGGVEETEITIPRVRLPDTKNAAGYYVIGEPVDLFIGGEGTLGVVAEIELALCRRPAGIIGVGAFLDHRDACLELMARVKAADGLRLLALEYMDGNSLRLLEERKRGGDAPGLPAFPGNSDALFYIESEYDGEREAGSVLSAVSRVLESARVAGERVWAAVEPKELELMRKVRHALPESVNAVIARRAASMPGLVKLATDLAVPDHALPTMMGEYSRLLSENRLAHVLFGHIGNSHLHMNIIPESIEELERGREVCSELARRAVALGGSVSGEHGIGRLKKHLLSIQFSPQELEGLRSLKVHLDPRGILNPAVMW
jgi:D-lactate dehydrogenase (cytochrome)